MQLKVEDDRGDGVTRVTVSGSVDQPHLSPFADPLAENVGDDVYSKKVMVGMQKVEVLDSTGVGWLLSCHKKMKEHGGALALHTVSPIARNVLKVLNMHMVFTIANTEEEALEKINA